MSVGSEWRKMDANIYVQAGEVGGNQMVIIFLCLQTV